MPGTAFGASRSRGVSQELYRANDSPAFIISRLVLAPGTRLGPYEILSTLGVGGMGEVYEADDTRLKRLASDNRQRTEDHCGVAPGRIVTQASAGER
ncbi:MAG TPA: hypothetical protein VMQ83_01330 [Gammaproteobacteria bacterium]|nr:hypothetical protein [Gammaproteobacteria bacterium]